MAALLGKIGLLLTPLLVFLSLGFITGRANAEPKPLRHTHEEAQIDQAVADRLRDTLNAVPAAQEDTAGTLRGILSDPKYTSGGVEAAPPTLLEKFLDWLGRLFKGTGLPMDRGWIVMLTGSIILAVVYLIVRVVWELLQRRSPRRRAAAGDVSPDDMSAASLIAAATAAAQRGDFRSAVRLRFLALVKELGLPAASWQTNSQLARQVKKLEPAAAAPFASAASRYEEVWYGGAGASHADFERLQAAALEVLAMLPKPAAEAR
jgi:hypothetical protein